MYGSKHKSDAIDDFTDLEGGSNLYQICENKKMDGASNAELREFLKENGIADDEIREWVRQIDSDFLAGKIKKKTPVSIAISTIIGGVLIFGGLGIIFFQLIIGLISLWLMIIAIGLISTGAGVVTKGYLRNKNLLRENKRFESRYKGTSFRKKY